MLRYSHWQIMSGKQTRVWVDRWIPTLPTGHPTSLGWNSAIDTLYVASIIDQDHSSWLLTPVSGQLSPTECNAILDTPIGDPSRYDRLVWAVDH